MDLVSAVKRVIVCMQHTFKGKMKVLEKCTIPVTGVGVVDTLITELSVFRLRNGELVLTEIAKETTLDYVKSVTGWNLKVADDLKEF